MPRGKRDRCTTATLSILLLALWLEPAMGQGLQALVGQWVAKDGTEQVNFRLDSGGNCSVDQIHGLCHVGADSITMRNANGSLTYNYRLQGGKLTFTGGDLDRPVVFSRTAAAPAPPPPAQAFVPPPPLQAQPPFAPPFQAVGPHPIVGRWAGQRGELIVAQDGTLSLNGEPPSRWQIQGTTLVVNDGQGVLRVPFQVQGNSLSVVVNGEQQVFQRLAGAAPATAAMRQPGGGFGGFGGGPPPAVSYGSGQELAGTWCYMANVTAQGGGRMAQRCFTLNPNGTYTYRAESNTSTIFGGSSSASADSGTWQVQGNTLYANSRNQGPQQYRLERRNHPRTRDPMLCLDGDCYVTATQRRPW